MLTLRYTNSIIDQLSLFHLRYYVIPPTTLIIQTNKRKLASFYYLKYAHDRSMNSMNSRNGLNIWKKYSFVFETKLERMSPLKQRKFHSKDFCVKHFKWDTLYICVYCSIFPFTPRPFRNPKVHPEFLQSAEFTPPWNDIAPDNLELAYFSIELDAQSEFFYISFSFQFLRSQPPLPSSSPRRVS